MSFCHFREPVDLTFDGFLSSSLIASALRLLLSLFEAAMFDFESVFDSTSLSVEFRLFEFSDAFAVSVLAFTDGAAARAAL